MKAILFLLFACVTFAQNTLVTGTLTVSGSPVTEAVSISWPASNLNTGVRREAGHMTIQPGNDGSISVSLLPSSMGVPPFLYTVTGSSYYAQWFVPRSSSSVTISSVNRGSSGGGGSGTVAGQTTNAVTVGGADATPVRGSGCSVAGVSLDEMTCKKFNSTGDATQSGVIDLKAKTSLNYYSYQAADTASPSVVEIAPINGPSAAGQAKRIGTRLTNQTVAYADGTKTDVTVNQMEWYTPQNLNGIANLTGKDSAALIDSQACTLSLDGTTGFPSSSELLYDCSLLETFGTFQIKLKAPDTTEATIGNDGFGFRLSGFSIPVKASSGGINITSAASSGPTTIYSSGTFLMIRMYCNINSGTGSVVNSLVWNDGSASRTKNWTIDTTNTYFTEFISIKRGSGNVTMQFTVTGTINYSCSGTVYE